MARIRTIKPSFFTSLTIVKLTLEARLTFIGLWTYVDDAGRCIYDPRLIKAAVWPLDDRPAAEVERDVSALLAADLVTHYVVTEPSVSQPGVLKRTSYLYVNGWGEHQRINRPTESHLPGPEAGEIMPLTCGIAPDGGLTEGSVSPHPRKGKEGNKDSVPTERAAQKRRAPRPDTGSATPDPAGDVARAVYDHAKGMVEFNAVRGIAARALRSQGATVVAVSQAMKRVYDRGKPITLQTVGQELAGKSGHGVGDTSVVDPKDLALNPHRHRQGRIA